MREDVAVKFENVTKRYFQGENYQPTFREWIDAIIKGDSFKRSKFKALDDVSFSIKKGNVVGLIGSNGAGKTTILKLISRVTFPNEGTVNCYGKVTGMLELGAGFHPELTGKENIYLYASILGFSRKKTDGLYNKVLDFSEIEDFIDTPVKHYSSGMYARLGFSVSILAEPDIMLIDEVLAVGDWSFQKKCINYMQNYCKNPEKTVIFVSHAMVNIRRICNEVIWLEKGKIRDRGDTELIVRRYIKEQKDKI